MREGTSKARKAAGAIFLRDTREANWGWFQRELLDFFAPLVGPYAVVVYICLCHAARGNDPTAQISLRGIEAMWTARGFRPALSKTSIARALRLLERAGMIREVEAATNRKPATYTLVSLPKLAAELTVDDCDNLALVLEHQRQRAREEAAGVPEGDARKLLKSSGKACGKDQISTEFAGTLGCPTDHSGVPQGHSLPINKEKHKEIHKPPYPPLSGGPEVRPAEKRKPP